MPFYNVFVSYQSPITKQWIYFFVNSRIKSTFAFAMKQKISYSKGSNSRSVAVFGYFLIILFSFQLVVNQAFPAFRSSSEQSLRGIPAVAIDPEFVTEQHDDDQPFRPTNTAVLSAASNGIEKDPSPDDVDEFDSDLPSEFDTVLHDQESLLTPSGDSFAALSSVSLVILYHCWKSFLH
jgi:hypothetical protein